MEYSKEGRILNLNLKYSIHTYPAMSVKIRKMSKRRQKIALRRKLEKELMQFVGRKFDSTLWHEIAEVTDDVVDSFFGKTVVELVN